MIRFWIIAPILLLLSASALAAARTHDKITTLNRQAENIPQLACKTTGGRAQCSLTLYHYEVDEEGQLYFTKLTAYADKNSIILRPGPVRSTFICQLNSDLTCEKTDANVHHLDLNAYAVSLDGVSVHDSIHPWSDDAKAEKFLKKIRGSSGEKIAAVAPAPTPHPKQTAEIPPPAPDDFAMPPQVPADLPSPEKMMQDLSCYMFDFTARVSEYRIHNHLVQDDSIQLLKADACMRTFQRICADPGSQQDELKLAAYPLVNAPPGAKKTAIKATDIRKFCNSIKEMKSAMLR